MKEQMQGSIGIDWVSTAMVMGAFIFGQIHAISARVRFAVMAAAFFAAMGYRINAGMRGGVNDVVLAVAGVAGLYYLVKALRYRPPPSAAD
ncbi:MAG: hypothetical protein K1X64_04530 [Myxococcaceae bacterium]|nr:hypothetical protein [Myxococcaceae bacterium]